jgi:hypothetical protein
MKITRLPCNQWFAYRPGKLFYNSSTPPTQQERYAAIRFNQQLRPVYPLDYYRDILKRDDLMRALQEPQPVIEPKRLRLWWDETENKGLWAGGLVFVTFIGVAFVVVLRRRSDPLEIAREFFAKAGFQKVEAPGKEMLFLHSPDGKANAMAMLWPDDESNSIEHLTAQIQSQHQRLTEQSKIYLVYKSTTPANDAIQSLREEYHCTIIPLFTSLLQQALSTDDCARVLKELEDPYLVRVDPYTESKPINDPIWFYGRTDLLTRLPAVLAQGQHVGIFGLRKVGKTSLTNQLRQRFVEIPTAFLDCQAFSAKATIYFKEILNQLHNALRHTRRIKGVPKLRPVADKEDFRQQFLELFELWQQQSGRREAFLIILDEIDKFFPSRRLKDSEEILAEYVRCFQVLRGLAQSRQCLVLLVIAYRPDVNRHNLLTDQVGENPMFRSFQEEHLGFLNSKDSEDLILKIGRWREISWDEDAAQRVFYYCGGHPLITRLFASEACEGGESMLHAWRRVQRIFKGNSAETKSAIIIKKASGSCCARMSGKCSRSFAKMGGQIWMKRDCLGRPRTRH